MEVNKVLQRPFKKGFLQPGSHLRKKTRYATAASAAITTTMPIMPRPPSSATIPLLSAPCFCFFLAQPCAAEFIISAQSAVKLWGEFALAGLGSAAIGSTGILICAFYILAQICTDLRIFRCAGSVIRLRAAAFVTAPTPSAYIPGISTWGASRSVCVGIASARALGSCLRSSRASE